MTLMLLEWVFTSIFLISVVLALRFALGKRISARMRYALWAVVLVRLLVPVQLFTSPIAGVWVFTETRMEQGVADLPPALTAPAADTPGRRDNRPACHGADAGNGANPPRPPCAAGRAGAPCRPRFHQGPGLAGLDVAGGKRAGGAGPAAVQSALLWEAAPEAGPLGGSGLPAGGV